MKQTNQYASSSIGGALIAGGIYLSLAHQPLITATNYKRLPNAFLAESISIRSADEDYASDFNRIAGQWEQQTGHLSVLKHAIANPLYLEIVGMRSKALPYLIRETQAGSPVWLPALRAIAGAQNRPDEGPTFQTAAAAWTKWWNDRSQYNAGMDRAI